MIDVQGHECVLNHLLLHLKFPDNKMDLAISLNDN